MFGKVKAYLMKNTNYGKSRYLNFLYKYDMERFFRYSGMNRNSDTIQTETEIRLLIHSIEKALSLPNIRPGFGREKIICLLQKYEHYCNFANCESFDEINAIVLGTIHAYTDFQREHCPDFDLSFISENYKNGNSHNCVGVDYDSVHDFSQLNFSEFANSRHSLRYFGTEPVSPKVIKKAVSLAQTAPSACNRQPIHVFACMSSSKINEIMSFHSGTNGFGVPSVIFAVTADLGSYISEYERNIGYIDGGIFVMNLLYALHYYELASCPIIWGTEPDNDRKLYNLLDIPETDTIISLIVAGTYPKNTYRFAKSKRKEIDSILHFVM